VLSREQERERERERENAVFGRFVRPESCVRSMCKSNDSRDSVLFKRKEKNRRKGHERSIKEVKRKF